MVAIDCLFFGLTALALFVFRRRDPPAARPRRFRVPGHPLTTLAFVAGAWLVVLQHGRIAFPPNALAGLGLLAAGVPVYLLWRRRGAKS